MTADLVGDELMGGDETAAVAAPVTVLPQFSPALAIVASLGGSRVVGKATAVVWPGAVLLAANGAIYAVGGAPYYGGANTAGRNKLPVGRKAVRLVAYGAKGYSVVDNENALYNFGS